MLFIKWQQFVSLFCIRICCLSQKCKQMSAMQLKWNWCLSKMKVRNAFLRIAVSYESVPIHQPCCPCKMWHICSVLSSCTLSDSVRWIKGLKKKKNILYTFIQFYIIMNFTPLKYISWKFYHYIKIIRVYIKYYKNFINRPGLEIESSIWRRPKSDFLGSEILQRQ